MDLKGKVAIVTGGATGIGFAIALEMAKYGADVVIASRNIDNLNKAVAEIETRGQKVTASKTNVTDKKQLVEMAAKVVNAFGKIDILVNNAAILKPKTSFLEITEDHWDEIMDTNLKGYFLCTQAVVPYMFEKRYGKIINITSMAALGTIRPGLMPYIVSKVGIIGLTKVCAKEFGPYNINVNSIAVGRIHTQMTYAANDNQEEVEEYLEYGKKVTVLGRLGEPVDIANLAVFLASDKSSFISGQIIHDDGGRIDRM